MPGVQVQAIITQPTLGLDLQSSPEGQVRHLSCPVWKSQTYLGQLWIMDLSAAPPRAICGPLPSKAYLLSASASVAPGMHLNIRGRAARFGGTRRASIDARSSRPAPIAPEKSQGRPEFCWTALERDWVGISAICVMRDPLPT
jgi:hypothetical protein